MTYKRATSTSTNLHEAERMKASICVPVPGCFKLSVENDGQEVFELAIFTEDASLAISLAAAVNGVLAQHNRLVGQSIPKTEAA